MGWGASARGRAEKGSTKHAASSKTAKRQSVSAARKAPKKQAVATKKGSSKRAAAKRTGKTQVAKASRPSSKKIAKRRVARRSSAPRVVATHSLPAIDNPPQVLSVAEQYLGRPYKFGGSSPNGIDCSGLTLAAFADVGVDLPHSAREQFLVGASVEPEDLKPGDLVFFSTYRRGASHVGIYAGEGYFVHAASRGGQVRVDRLEENYYARHFIGARRIPLADGDDVIRVVGFNQGGSIPPVNASGGASQVPALIPAAVPEALSLKQYYRGGT